MANDFQQLYQTQASEKPADSKAYDDNAKRVEDRFWSMSFVKQDRRQVWDGVQRLYYPNDLNWIVSGDDFNAPVRFSTLRDVVSALTDKYMENLPEAVLRAHNDEDENLIRGKKAYIDYIQRQPHYKKIRRMAIQDMFFFGDGFMRTNYTDRRRLFKGEKEPEELFRDVCTSHVSARDIFVDDAATMLHDDTRLCGGARDIIIRRLMPYSTFQKEVAPREGFKTGGVQALPFIEAMGTDWLTTNTRELMEKSNVQMVKLYEYESIEDDTYTVVANGHTIFEGGLKECRGTTSFDVVNYKFEPRNDSFWSQCLAELIAANIYAKDTIFNLELLNLKLTLQPVLAMSGDFGYNPRVHVLQPGGVWTAGGKMQGKIGDNISPIVAGNPQTKAYDMLNYLSSELTTTARTNIQSLEFAQDQTATRSLQIDQSQSAHSARISSINEIEAETVQTKNIMQVMEAFMCSDKNEKAKPRKVPIMNYRVREGENGKTVFFEKNGYEDLFSMSDEMINVKCRVEVLDKRSEKVAQAEMMGRIMQFLPMVANMAQVDPTIAQGINFMGLIEQAVDAIGLEHSKTFKEDASTYDDEYQMLKEEILLGNTVELPGTDSRKESHAKLDFLMALYDQEGDEFNDKQKMAFSHVFMQVMENITRNHLNEKYQQQAQTGISPEEQAMAAGQQQTAGPNALPGGQLPAQGNSAGMNVPTSAQALGGSVGGKINPGGMKTLPQPDPSVLNPSGRELA